MELSTDQVTALYLVIGLALWALTLPAYIK